jgi:hypothetical protein
VHGTRKQRDGCESGDEFLADADVVAAATEMLWTAEP